MVATTVSSERFRLITFVGALAALGAILLNLDFFFRPGTEDVLTGLVHHLSVLALLLILTAHSRTVSLVTLGCFWLVGVWTVYAAAYLLESGLSDVLGKQPSRDEFVTVWLAPFVEETAKAAPVAAFLLLGSKRAGRHPSMSDGLLLGFMVGAGVSFHEDAHYGEILVSGEGWSSASPWSAVFPTISPLDERFALNHALWAALSGLTVGVGVMFRHKAWALLVALTGPLLSFANHLMANHITFTEFGTTALLRRAGGQGVPWLFETVRDLTMGGRAQMAVLIAGALLVVVTESLILRPISRRDRRFPPLPFSRATRIAGQATSGAGLALLMAADSYSRLRRQVYFGVWHSTATKQEPNANFDDFIKLTQLRYRLGLSPLDDGPSASGAAPGSAGLTDIPLASSGNA